MRLSSFQNSTIKIQKPTIATTASTHAKQSFSDVATNIPAVKQNSRFNLTVATTGELVTGLYDFYFLKSYTTDVKTGYLIIDNTLAEYVILEIYEYSEHFKVVANIKGR